MEKKPKEKKTTERPKRKFSFPKRTKKSCPSCSKPPKDVLKNPEKE